MKPRETSTCPVLSCPVPCYLPPRASFHATSLFRVCLVAEKTPLFLPSFASLYTNYVICTIAASRALNSRSFKARRAFIGPAIGADSRQWTSRARNRILRGFVHLEPSNPRLYRFTLHLAVSGVPAGAYGFPDNHQVAPALAKRLEAGLGSAQRPRARRRRRNLRDLGRGGRRASRCEATERLADDAAALARPHSRAMAMPLLPSVDGSVRTGERETRTSLALAVQNEV